MQRLSFLALIALMAVLPAAAQAINGNGNLVTQVRPLDRFSSVSLDFVAEVTITVGSSPGIEITTDDNILPHIGTRIKGGTLVITQEGWIEPSEKARIIISTPMLASLETSGYSTIEVQGLEGPRFNIDAGVGRVVAHGTVERLRVRTKTGTVDASELKARTAEITIESSGTVFVNAAEVIEADVSERGRVVYVGEPEIKGTLQRAMPMAGFEANPTPAPGRIDFKIRNNRAGRSNFEVEGPEGARFSYGFPMLPFVSRDENWPVGSRVYQISRLGARTLVYTVAVSDSGTTVNLFNR